LSGRRGQQNPPPRYATICDLSHTSGGVSWTTSTSALRRPSRK
jgi:hypothetical protein